MALTIESGAIVTGADSYVTLAEYQAYATALGWIAAGDAADEVSLRRAFHAINRRWSYLGEKVAAGQVGAWPRYITEYVDGFSVDSDTIPQSIKDAQCELAYLIQGGLDPFETVAGVVETQRDKAGPVETQTTYMGGKSTPRLVAVEGLLSPYLASGAGAVRMARG